jgi:hypothetical protein
VQYSIGAVFYWCSTVTLTGETHVNFVEHLLSDGGIKKKLKKTTLCGA